MDDYSLLIIFDKLNFTELLNVADASTIFRELIIDHYMIPKYQLHKKVLRVALSEVYYDSETENFNIYTFSIVLRILRNFGHIITKLYFEAAIYDKAEVAIIAEYVEKYCSRSLVEITGNDYPLSKSNQSFEKVHIVDFRFSHQMTDFQIHRSYPYVEELKIRTYNPVSDDVLVYPCPYLYKLDFHEVQDSKNASFITNFLRLNPQLQTLRLEAFVSLELLLVIRDNVPNLTSLTLAHRKNDFFQSKQIIHLPSVDHFTLDVIWYDLGDFERFPITFDNLISLEISSLALKGLMIDLVKQNNEILSLSLPLSNIWDVFTSMVAIHLHELSKLEVIRLWWSNDMSAEDLSDLLGDVEKLKKIIFGTWSGVHTKDLFSKILEEWKISDISDNDGLQYLTLERSNSSL